MNYKNISYYICDNEKFTSKIQALQHSLKTKKPVDWVFYNNIFSKYNWTVEPEHSLNYYYAKRARELREQYDYLILSFSGGADTNNILETFIQNNIHLDEIVVIHHTDLTKNFTVLDNTATNSTNFYAEHELQTVPRLKYAKEKLPRTKITLLDTSENLKNALINSDEDWIFNKTETLQFYLRRFNLNYFKETKNEWDKGKSIGVITGLDKPQTFIQTNKNIKSLYLQFTDLTISIPAKIDDFNIDYETVSIEMFYWHPNCFELISKQCHTIKKFLELNKNYQFFWSKKSIGKKNIGYGDMFRLVHEKVLRTVLYDNWNTNWFQTTKTLKFWYSDYDTWFRSDPLFNKQYETWKRGIQLLSDTLGEYVLFRDGKPDRILPFYNKFYIGDLKNG